jgi:oligopeptidase B
LAVPRKDYFGAFAPIPYGGKENLRDGICRAAASRVQGCGLGDTGSLPMQSRVTPPKAKTVLSPVRIPLKDPAQTVEIHDPYAWLRDRENPEVFEYLRAENAYTEAMMEDTKALQQRLYEEMVGRIQETDRSAPVRDGSYWYYSRTEQGKEYGIHCRRKAGPTGGFESAGAEEVLLDGNVLAEGQEYFELGAFVVSLDHRFLAYSVDFSGEEKFLLRVKNLETGEHLPDEIPNTYYSVEWSGCGQYLFYTTLDEQMRPYRLWRHALGEEPRQDVLLYEETDRAFHLEVSLTRSERFLLLESASLTTTETRILPAAEPLGEFRVFLPRKPDVEYTLEHQGEHFWFTVNDRGRNFRLVRVALQAIWDGEAGSHEALWEEVLPHRETVCLEDVDGFERYVVVSERDNGLEQLLVIETENGEQHRIEWPEAVYTAGLGSNPMYRSETLRVSYQSPVTPPTDLDYHVPTRQREVVKQKAIGGGFDAANYAVERLFATAPDGVDVPLSVVYRRDTPRDGSAPALLYGYGSYGLTTDPGFSSDRLSLLDRGFVYAIAHIRGSGDLGETWHDAGKMLGKKNSFTDFIACAEKLIAEGFTRAERLGILGRSAGGLLMGAVTNLRPDLFGAVIASVPFVDVLNTMLDDSLPLTVGEFEEWGNPQDPLYFDYIRSYSPYDNVEAKEYPPMLVTAGVNDPRVSYWEPAKYVAKLRAMATGDRLLLLKTEMDAGHFGPSGRYESWKETAFEYAFLLKTLAPAAARR